tara:strand:- start:455 stop:766 length:312 start_codon:yes stop_codon:yes gene_type:complete
MLGLFTGLQYQQQVSDSPAAAIQDNFWQVQRVTGPGVDCLIEPVPAVLDNHDLWDLTGSNDYMPYGPTVAGASGLGSAGSASEGFWHLDKATGAIFPLDTLCS